MYMKDIDRKPDADIRAAIDETVAEAQKQFNLAFEGEYPLNGGIGINVVRPTDVGHPTSSKDYWDITISTADTYQNWIATTVDKDIFILMAGVFDTTTNPGVNEIQITANGQDMPVMNLGYLLALEEPKIFFPKPITCRNSAYLKVQVSGRIAQAEKLGLMGYTIGKRSFLITQ